MRGRESASAGEQRCEKLIGERKLSFLGAGDRWWLQEGERRIPLRLRETESTLTNTQTHEKEIRRWHDVEVAPLKALALGDDVYVRASETATQLTVTFVTGKAVIYNSAIYDIDRLELTLPPDWSRAELWIDHHFDMSD